MLRPLIKSITTTTATTTSTIISINIMSASTNFATDTRTLTTILARELFTILLFTYPIYYLIKRVYRFFSRADTVRFVLEEGARSPRLNSNGAAGFDLYALEQEPIVLKAMQTRLISTGVRMEIPSIYYGRIASRSSMVTKYNTDVRAGVIDPDYRGTIKVALMSYTDVTIPADIAIAQLIFERFATPPLRKCASLNCTKRGAGGFGSTNVTTDKADKVEKME